MKVDELLYFIKPKNFKTHSLPKRLIVSLTSYPKRFSILHLALKSILNQSLKPDKIILWLWHKDCISLPANIRELESEGLEIKLLEDDWKSFNKSIPVLYEFPDDYLVTADDDVIYNSTWLEELVMSHKKIGGIIAQRAHLVQFNIDKTLKSYNDFMSETPQENYFILNSPLVFPTTCGGVLYPPNSFDKRVLDMSTAFELVPTNDDIWCFFMHLLNNKNASLIGGRTLLNLNTGSENQLWNKNKTANDIQIQAMIKKFGLPKQLKSLIDSTCEAVKKDKACKLINGSSLIIKNDEIGNIIDKSKMFYEEELISYVKRNFAPREVIDIGSEIGNHALGFSGIDEYKVHCFESNKELCEILKKNLSNNNIKNEITNIDLSNSKEHTLDQLKNKDFLPDLIKISANGYEHEVLIGAKEVIKKNLPILIIEHKNYENYLKCMTILNEYNYRPIKVMCHIPKFIYANNVNYNLGTKEKINWVDGWKKFNKSYKNKIYKFNILS